MLRFLRVRKYDVDAAMQTIRRYYKVRLACGPVYRDFLPTKVSPAARSLLMVMPEKDVHGRPVLLLKIGEWIPSELPFPELHKAWAICVDHITSDPVTQVLGVVLLFDYNGFTIDKLFGISIGLLKKALEYVQDCMPMRMKGMHMINQSYAFDVLYMLVKPVIKPKLSERLHFHGENYARLHEEISPSALPEEYGGRGPPLDYEAFWRRVDSEERLFVADSQYGYTGTTAEEALPTETDILEELTFL